MRLVNCCILSLELLNYDPVREKKAFRKCPRNDDLSWVDPEYQLRQAFSHSIGGQHESVR
jgi:hypothetical protein